MKKNYLKIALVSAFAIAVGYNVYSSQEEVKLSEMALENVEALAGGESGNYDCYAPYTLTCSYEGGIRIPGVKG